nr:GNAT family N-acetyltransferase [Aneurinibacillus sp. XH2]
MNNMYVRWASAEDSGALVRLNNKFNGVGVSASEVEQSLQNSNELVAIAVLDETPAGFACAQFFKSFCYSELVGEITELYVEEEARGKGLATLLIRFLEEELIRLGVTNIKVLTGNNNRAGIRTYEKSGYKLRDELVFEKEILG